MTSIEWTDRTWNPIRGCSRISPGCENCYAEKIAARFSDPGQTFNGFADRSKSGSKWTGKVGLVTEKLFEPLKWRKPVRVFVNSMSDLFHADLSSEEISAVFGVMGGCPDHTFQVLTKRAEDMRHWFVGEPDTKLDECDQEATKRHPKGARYIVSDEAEWPLQNVWLGVSVEDQQRADERIPHLLATPAAVRFLSCEPLVGPLDLRPYLHWIDWVIIGGESGPGARRFDLRWAKLLLNQCDAAGVPVFIKQIGANPGVDYGQETVNGHPLGWQEIPQHNRKGNDPAEWPESLSRREFPV